MLAVIVVFLALLIIGMPVAFAIGISASCISTGTPHISVAHFAPHRWSKCPCVAMMVTPADFLTDSIY